MAARGLPSRKVDRRKRRNANSGFHGTTGPVADRDRPAGFDPDRQLLTVAQAAEICQISERQLRRMIRDGRILVLRFGCAIRIRPSDLGI